MNYNDFFWHDAIIKNIQIDGNNPGIKDTMIFEIKWPEEKGRTTFVFEDIYSAEMSLNIGIVSDETILNSMQLEENNEYLTNFYSKWKGTKSNVKLNTYIIDLNSTGGKKNYCKNIKRRYNLATAKTGNSI
ncbi:MAG TPA: hypothetical protein VL053_04000 [Arachidicoccus sp.]|nr:hypothetical protein [Arachidicoccus sp.]